MSIRKRHPYVLAALCVAILGLSAGSLAAADLRGRVDLVDSKGRRAAGARQTIVYFTPDAGIKPTPAPAEPFEIVTVRKDFQPHVLTVPVGSTVRFPNEDTILHNVFSVSGKNRFDLGLYRKGDAREATLNEPGVVRVFCNVHHSMAAYVVVLATPYYTQADANGDFVLSGLPEGPGTLTVWHERSDRPWSGPADVAAKTSSSETLTVRMELNRDRVPKHLNKLGRTYSRSRRGRDYR